MRNDANFWHLKTKRALHVDLACLLDVAVAARTALRVCRQGRAPQSIAREDDDTPLAS